MECDNHRVISIYINIKMLRMTSLDFKVLGEGGRSRARAAGSLDRHYKWQKI